VRACVSITDRLPARLAVGTLHADDVAVTAWHRFFTRGPVTLGAVQSNLQKFRARFKNGSTGLRGRSRIATLGAAQDSDCIYINAAHGRIRRDVLNLCRPMKAQY
jgi:hypothetical protein